MPLPPVDPARAKLLDELHKLVAYRPHAPERVRPVVTAIIGDFRERLGLGPEPAQPEPQPRPSSRSHLHGRTGS